MTIFEIMYNYTIVPLENIYVNGEKYVSVFDDDREVEYYSFTWCEDRYKTRLEFFTKE